MEPLEPNDPLWKLLGKGRAVEPRPNFTQNVLRAARQTPQTRSWWAKMSEWFSDHPSALPRLAASAAVVAVVGISLASEFASHHSSSQFVKAPSVMTPTAAVAEPPLLAVETQLENLDQVSALLALEDTSTLTDSEISFLLY